MSNKGYRRIELKAERASRPPKRARKLSPLRIALAIAGAALLVASGVQLVELMSAMPRPAASTAAMAALPKTSVAWTTVLGAVVMPIAAVLCFVAFSATRTRAIRS